MKKILEQAKEIEKKIIEHRHYLHQCPEIGFDLPKTRAYVINVLTQLGYQPKEIGGGIVTTIGEASKGKTIMLRADMDALNMQEDNDLAFKSKNNYAHTCGHDTHTAMLLGVAELLKNNVEELQGCVKLMFQPNEESMGGAKAMIEEGLLENPKVDVALGLHSISGVFDSGMVVYSDGAAQCSSDIFKISIQGKGAHGSTPEVGVDPITIAIHIHLALQELISREAPSDDKLVLTVGKFVGGTAANIIPDSAVLEGTLRSNNEKSRQAILVRMKEIVPAIAKVYRGEAIIEFEGSAPVLVNNKEFVDQMVSYFKDYPYPVIKNEGMSAGSEDFAYVCQNVPSMFFYLGTGSCAEGYLYSQHHPKILFNEEVFYLGTALLTYGAMEWLEKGQK